MFQFILGACVGAGLALLYAPATGRTMRARLRDKAVRAQHDVQRLGDQVGKQRRHWSNKLQGLRHELGKAGEEAAEKIEDTRDKAISAMEDFTPKSAENLHTGIPPRPTDATLPPGSLD